MLLWWLFLISDVIWQTTLRMNPSGGKSPSSAKQSDYTTNALDQIRKELQKYAHMDGPQVCFHFFFFFFKNYLFYKFACCKVASGATSSQVQQQTAIPQQAQLENLAIQVSHMIGNTGYSEVRHCYFFFVSMSTHPALSFVFRIMKCWFSHQSSSIFKTLKNT